MSLIKSERRSVWPIETVWPEERVDRAFRDLMRNFLTGEGLLDRVFDGRSMLIRVEEFVEGSECVIRAELPGIDPDKDVEISLAEGILHLRAQREEHTEEDKPSGYRSEFRYGTFERSFRLPEGTTDADVKATYKNGILEVRVPAPKETSSQPAQVKVPITHD